MPIWPNILIFLGQIGTVHPLIGQNGIEMPISLSLEKILVSQGFGSRRHCRTLIQSGLVQVNGELKTDPAEKISIENMILSIEGKPWEHRQKVYVVLNKPTGYECSHQATHHPSIYRLFPDPLIERGLQCVGRLDHDTSGLIFLSDDGAFIHALTSPKKNIGKTYEITTADPLTDEQIQRLLTGVVLHDDPLPVSAQACVKKAECALSMTITEGRYHQVKRMLAAVGNKVVGLHRSSIGTYGLPEDLQPGEWRFLCDTEASHMQLL